MATLKQAGAAIRRVADEMRETEDLEAGIARVVLTAARRAAGMRPSPQARMAASGFGIEQGDVVGHPGRRVSGRGGPTTLGAVGWGSELGSTRYRQFAPRSSRGYWLGPAADDPGPPADAVEERWIDDALDAALRGVK